jgi:antitoxin (DNA-binding transcriptional repressor) of toxin-antitoxin stability system
MKTSYTIGEFKAHLPEALEAVKKGGTISITYGRARRPVAELVSPARVQKRRNLGALSGKVKVSLSEDWKMDEEAFLNS